MLTFAVLLACAGMIYFACEYFVNAIEWLACRMNVGQTATGTLLAAFGTALPESAVTLMAVAFHPSAASKQIGIGAVMGGPLVLATISYAVVGITLWMHAKKLGRVDDKLHLNQRRLSDDQGWFLLIFIVKIALGFVVFSGKPWLGVLFIAAYALYIRKEMRGADAVCEAMEPLRLRPRAAAPGLFWIVVQVIGALTVITIASHYFVMQLEATGTILGLSPQLVALLFSPLATELPETMNAVIWLRQGREKLALANISGAMMIQATVPSAFGLFFTPWLFDRDLTWAAGVTLLAIILLFAMFRRGNVTGKKLALIGLLYAVFIAGLLI